MINLKLANIDDEEKIPNLIDEFNVKTIDPRIHSKGLKKLPFKFNVEMLDIFCDFCSRIDDGRITPRALINIRTMMEMTDLSNYINSDSIMARFEYITRIIEARVNYNITDTPFILQYLERTSKHWDYMNEYIVPYVNQRSFSEYYIKYINTMVYENLAHFYSTRYFKIFLKFTEDVEMGVFKRPAEVGERFKEIVAEYNSDMRLAEQFQCDNRTFDLTGNYNSTINETMTRLTSPDNRLKTGSRWLNNMLRGGYEKSRVYVFLAITGDGKSVVLLNQAEQCRRYNKYKAKIKGNRGAILYITQENSLDETIERLFNMKVSNEDIRNYTPEQVKDLLKTKGELRVEDDDDLDLVIKFYKDKEISASDLLGIIDDLKENGTEVVGVFHDYMQRARSDMKFSEFRFELAEIANQFHNIAQEKGIPIVTAAQLNRAAITTLKEAEKKGLHDQAKLLDLDNVGESHGMLQNIDSAMIIRRETVKLNGELVDVLTFSSNKARDSKGKEIKYFVHPFKDNNGITMVEDINEPKAASFKSVEDFINAYSLDVNRPSRPADANPMPLERNMLTPGVQNMFGMNPMNSVMSPQLQQSIQMHHSQQSMMMQGIQSNVDEKEKMKRKREESRRDEKCYLDELSKSMKSRKKNNEYNLDDNGCVLIERSNFSKMYELMKSDKFVDGRIMIEKSKSNERLNDKISSLKRDKEGYIVIDSRIHTIGVSI